MRPAALDDIGLGPALNSLIERMRILHGVEIEVRLDLASDARRTETRLVPEVESTVYRLVQEALSNIGKHAGAAKAHVEVVETDSTIRLQVRDDGKGFDPTQPKAGFGLVGMRERIDLIGGAMAVDSSPGDGTSVRAEVPGKHRSVPA